MKLSFIDCHLLESDISHSVMHGAEVVNAQMCIFTTTMTSSSSDSNTANY